MKALKLILIATVVSFAMMSYGYAAEVPNGQKVAYEQTIKMPLELALKYPGLVCAMYQQLTPAFLQNEVTGFYTAVVRYKAKRISVYGTHEAWVEFFRNKPGGAHNN